MSVAKLNQTQGLLVRLLITLVLLLLLQTGEVQPQTNIFTYQGQFLPENHVAAASRGKLSYRNANFKEPISIESCNRPQSHTGPGLSDGPNWW